MCYNQTGCIGEPIYNGTAEDCCAQNGSSTRHDNGNCTELRCSGSQPHTSLNGFCVLIHLLHLMCNIIGMVYLNYYL